MKYLTLEKNLNYQINTKLQILLVICLCTLLTTMGFIPTIGDMSQLNLRWKKVVPVIGTSSPLTEQHPPSTTTSPATESTSPVHGTTSSVQETTSPVTELTSPAVWTTSPITESTPPAVRSTVWYFKFLRVFGISSFFPQLGISSVLGA